MSNKEKFIEEITKGYSFKGDSIIIGGAMLDGECQTGTLVKIPLKTLNRHGLIAGATGSGKTKTLQILAEQMSAKGIPSLLMDIKGDLSGIAVPSDGHPKIDERHEKIGFPFEPGDSPVEFLSLSGEKGVKLRATVTEFGPVLLSKILQLNNTQSGVIAVAFKYADDKDLPLLDLKDLKKILQWISKEGKKEIEADFGRISTSTVGAIMRKIVELEQQGADTFFGERSFDVEDLCRIDENGKGIVSVLRLTDIQDKPKLFSTFMLQMLAEIYTTFPEKGDSDQPELVIFIDEAHLIFKESSKALLDQIETIVKLIRSKGVGVYFVTQNPADIPEDVLGQLGLKIQHALRAFTAKDRKAIKLAAENYPITEFYDTKNIFTKLGIGEAMITGLNEKGIPTPLVHTMLRAPQSRMDVLTENEIDSIIKKSEIIREYNEEIDRESAYEILTKKIKSAHEEQNQRELMKQNEKVITKRTTKKEKSTFDEILNSQVGKTITRELTRGILGMLGIKTTTRRRRKTSRRSGLWF
jgi:DNA helicase HerA-like ATPase